MKYSWIDTELLQKPGVTKDLQAEWNWIRYHIGGKMFAAVCLDDATGKPVLSFSVVTAPDMSQC